ncbi:MAG: hypothetical protein H0S79_22370 [Anaerolineaceae bacterium]|nr:hypothetical protein [Anaerolineaceae bacterium]
MAPLLTLFTAPKSFENPHINTIQRNTLRNWLALGDEVAVAVIGDDPGVAEVCAEYGIQHLSDVRTNPQGTPLISSIFQLGRDLNDSPFLVYANADILFLPDLVTAVKRLAAINEPFLAVGQRYDMDITESVDFSGEWPQELKTRIAKEGKLHGQTGSDYFIYPRGCFEDIPDFAVGRAGWDNWMLYQTRYQGWKLIDATPAITVIHQNHDYAHLPGGVIHFRQPETDVNVKLAGGRRTIFNATDSRYLLTEGGLERKPLGWKGFWREVEVFPLIRLHSRLLGMVSFAIFHPVLAYKEVRGWLAYKLKQNKAG